MGLFSKCCAKTNMPVLYPSRRGPSELLRLSRIVVLTRDGQKFEAEYDGYGLGLVSEGSWDSAKFVLSEAYAGEAYDDLPDSAHEPNQGFFFSAAQLEVLSKVASFKTFDAYDDFVIEMSNLENAKYEELLTEKGFPSSVKWYHSANALEELQSLGEHKDDELVLSRYNDKLQKYPELAAVIPANLDEAIAYSKEFHQEVGRRIREGLTSLLDKAVQEGSAVLI